MAYYDKGTYKARITGQGFSESQNKGTPLFYLTIQPFAYVTNGETIELAEAKYERRIEWYITNKTISFVMEKLERLGFQGTSFASLEPTSGDYHSFVGLEIDVFCNHDQGQDSTKTYEKWDLARNDLGGGGSAPQRLDNKGISKLDALFGKQLSQRFGGASAKPRQQPQGVPASQTRAAMSATDDSDIPF